MMDLENDAKNFRLSRGQTNSGSFLSRCKINSKKTFVWENRLKSKRLFDDLYKIEVCKLSILFTTGFGDKKLLPLQIK